MDIERLNQEYNRVKNMSPEEATKDSPLKVESFMGEGTPQQFYSLNRSFFPLKIDDKQVKEIISSLDSENRWLTKHISISNPYIGEGQKKEATDEFASTDVGDETDTSPFRDPSGQDYISTSTYIRNMNILMGYLQANRKKNLRCAFAGTLRF